MGKKFNEILISLRKNSGLTQAEFAKRIGVSRSAVGNYEKGVRRPDFEITEAIADYFNVSLGYLLGRDESDKELYNRYRKKLFMKEKEKKILELYRQLNTEGQKKVQAYMEDLAGLPRYTEPSPEDSEVNSVS